ncbi:uncharacterized protein [Henckelia pumila]|uniref:uncharacterized protein n=1 Tax=Henckelia pumila TaxID=405737 RepID=UPI003C6E3B0F
MAYDRSWMDWRIVNGLLTNEFVNGVEVFVAFTKSNPTCLSDGTIMCPCNRKKCQTLTYLDEITVKEHFCRYGFVPNYYNWFFHGENYIHPSFPGVNMDAPSSSRSSRRTTTDDLPPYFTGALNRDTYSKNEYQLGSEQPYYDYQDVTDEEVFKEDHDANVVEDPNVNVTEENPNIISRALYDMIKSIEKEILEGNPHGHTLLSVLARFCEHPRYKHGRSRGSRNNKKLTPYKRMYYFPLTPRLQRLYASEATSSHMRWHHDHIYDGETMTHLSDSPAWRNFTETHLTFASEIRNVRLALSADGFQPFGQSGQQYSSWIVILTPYNLSSWMCMKDEYMFLTVLAPGPKNPKDKLDVFLQPLVAELQSLWFDGAITYDVHSRTNITLRATLTWTINDFPAYAMLSGWNTAGKQACPHCKSDSEAFTLQHIRKTCWFDNHRKFLPVEHPLRQSRNLFISGRTVSHTARPMRTGFQLLDELDSYGFLPSYEVDAEEHNKE